MTSSRRFVPPRLGRGCVRLVASLAILLGLCACNGSEEALILAEDQAAGRPADASAELGDGTVKVRHPSDYLRVTRYPTDLTHADLATWNEQVPAVRQVEIASSADATTQPALFYDSGSDRAKPLLLVPHSWSTNYLQSVDIPLAQFAIANDWVFMHPDFRGPNDGRPQTTASDTVMTDIADALAYARDNARVDPSRLYLLGYSGGAMNALRTAARYPQVFAGVSVWVPIHDLTRWYDYTARRGEKYASEISQACGGAPTEGSAAHAECLSRSPRAHLPAVAGELRVFIAHGMGDRVVPPGQSLRVFNDLALEDDRIPEHHIEYVNDRRELPPALRERSLHGGREFPRFAEAGADVLLYLRSGPAELVLFKGGHDMLYRPALEWLARQRQE